MQVHCHRYDPHQSHAGSCATQHLHRCQCVQTMTTSCSAARETTRADRQKVLLSAAMDECVDEATPVTHIWHTQLLQLLTADKIINAAISLLDCLKCLLSKS